MESKFSYKNLSHSSKIIPSIGTEQRKSEEQGQTLFFSFPPKEEEIKIERTEKRE